LTTDKDPPGISSIAVSASGSTVLAHLAAWVHRSTDGGTTWTRIAVAGRLRFHPSDDRLAIAASAAGPQYSVDGGLTWTVAAGAGTQIIGVEYATSDPLVVYASSHTNQGALYRSADGGQTYAAVNTTTPYLGPGPYGTTTLWVDPTNSDILVVGNAELWRSTDGGQTLTQITNSASPGIRPRSPRSLVSASDYGPANRRVFVGSGLGVHRADDILAVTPASEWTALNHGLSLTQFLTTSAHRPTGTILGGTVGQGVIKYTPDQGPDRWTTLIGGRSASRTVQDVARPAYIYATVDGLPLQRSLDGGATWTSVAFPVAVNLISPLTLDPLTPDTLYVGSPLYRSTNAFDPVPTWTAVSTPTPTNPSLGTIVDVAVPPKPANTLWISSATGYICRSLDANLSLPSWLCLVPTPQLMPGHLTSGWRIFVDPHSYASAYWLIQPSGNAYVYYFDDNGHLGPRGPWRWTNAVAVHPRNPKWVYYATNQGILTSENGGYTVAAEDEGPASVETTDLFFIGETLYAATYGAGLFAIDLGGGVPDAVVPLGPAGTVYSMLPTYSWTPDPGATWYQVIATDAMGRTWTDWVTAEQARCATGTCAVCPGWQLAFGSGRFQVRGWNEYGSGPLGAEMAFSVAPAGSIAATYPVSGARPGLAARLWALVSNALQGPLPAEALVWFYVDGPGWTGSHWVGSAPAGSVAPAGSSWVGVDWNIPSDAPGGPYTYWAQLYLGGPSSTWSAGQSFWVDPTPPIAATVIRNWPPPPVARGGSATLWAYVENAGGAALPADATVWFLVSAGAGGFTEWVGPASAAGLSPGARQWFPSTWNVPSSLPPGTYYIWARVYRPAGGISDWSERQTIAVQ
jgi:hypothetical protein